MNGKAESFGHLSFDQYDQDQVINLEEGDVDGQHYGGLAIHDYPDTPLDLDLFQRMQKLPEAERNAQIERLKATGAFGYPRAYFGKSKNRDA
ncbi:MAG: hypothetical protein J2P31_13010, partial [Blastocatellia bacterium]|nr:hypothetical protein [Blastocatellia bacterium]